MTLAQLIVDLYEAHLAQLGDPDLASVAAAASINDILASMGVARG